MADANLWGQARRLDGTKLKTLVRGREFEVSNVTTNHLLVRPLGSKGGKRLVVYREDIEHIAEKGWQRDELRSRTAAELPACGVTSYVAAIVHELTHGFTAQS